MSVLIIAQEHDPHTVAVVQEVQRLGQEAVVADLSEFPQHSNINVRYTCCGARKYTFGIGSKTYDLGDFGSAWWRRPQHPRVSSEIVNETHRLFAANECSEALSGLWHALDLFWVNDPARDQVAHRKVTQLRVAQQCGFRLPDTLITNDAGEARVFLDRRGYRNVIYKSFSALDNAWRETRLLRQEELELLDYVRFAPVIFQEYVEAIYDVRVTVVGQNMFAAAIHSQQTSYKADFRMDMANARIEAVELPDTVQARIISYVAALGLQYGAIDMRLRPDGEYVFLEINPAGQWLFVEEATRQPIAASLAKLLVQAEPGGRS